MSHHFVSFESARLLVVDDDPILREFAVSHLSTDEVTVEVAEDGEAAWRILSKQDFDIVLLDLDMPRMDGFELLGLMRADPRLRHVPVVVATGREDMVAVDKAFASGATSFVVKPLNWRLISHQLSYVLRNARDEAAVRGALKQLQDDNMLKGEVLRLSHGKLSDSLTRLMQLTDDMEGLAVDAALAGAVKKMRDTTRTIQTLHADMARAMALIQRS
ncbi:response regulator [Asticcacaulis sp. BYS171W]|uniref:Response regulator n=1 Tax=Asticcacaulis aquaticus TaxID=2984212 RepID=A0ABT5HXR9_9CAUL|nr:response regulator [Asticcacaulis aquaticus]MDC7684866.1 response regulator [Asticcacaulis aquaticus]